MKGEDLGRALEESIKSTEIVAIEKESLESVISIITDTELIELIPGVKFLWGCYKEYNKIKEQAELKKLLLFLNELKSIDEKKRQDLVNILDQDESYRIKTFERIILLIERLDEVEKASIVGKLFKAYLLKDIDKETFFRLCFALENIFFGSLKGVVELSEHELQSPPKNIIKELKHLDDFIKKDLTKVGLIDEKLEENKGLFAPKYFYRYRISSLGLALYKHGLL